MPWTIFRHLLTDILRTMVITAGVLVTVIAFGAAVKPLALGQLAPADILRYVAYAIIPMMQFALPFAAGFAGTLVLHRLTTDNEVQAAAVSGVSAARYLIPVMGLGVILLLIMLWLSHFMIPYFWARMERVIARDVVRLLESSVRDGQAFVFGDIQVYARDIMITEGPPGSDIDTRLVLQGVAAAELGDDGTIETDVTARVAFADIRRTNGRATLSLQMFDTVGYSRADNTLGEAPAVVTPRPFQLPTDFSDNPKFMSLGRLREVRAFPDTFGPIVQEREALAWALQQADIWRTIRARLETNGMIFAIDDEAGREYVIRGERIANQTITRAEPGPVQVLEREGDVVVRNIECRRVNLSVVRSDRFGMAFDVEFIDCTVTRPLEPDRPPSERGAITLTDVRIPDLRDERLAESSSQELVQIASSQPPDQEVTERIEALEDKLSELDAETLARLTQRSAISMTAPLLLLLGSLLAMWRRNALPLAIYALAFFPAVADLLIISSGEQMMRHEDIVPGRLLAWTGNVAMILAIAFVYHRVRRH